MLGTSLVVWWLGFHTSTAGGTGLILGRGTMIPHAARQGQKKKIDMSLFILSPKYIPVIIPMTYNQEKSKEQFSSGSGQRGKDLKITMK